MRDYIRAAAIAWQYPEDSPGQHFSKDIVAGVEHPVVDGCCANRRTTPTKEGKTVQDKRPFRLVATSKMVGVALWRIWTSFSVDPDEEQQPSLPSLAMRCSDGGQARRWLERAICPAKLPQKHLKVI